MSMMEDQNDTTETDEDSKNIGVSMERSKAGTREKSPDGLSL